MTRIADTFEKLKAEKSAALVTYIMGGDPDIETSLEILKGLPEAGADIIELGMPFTDPAADGPAIQAAGLRALDVPTGIKDVLGMVRNFREQNSHTPMVLMGYYNPVLQYGPEKFANDAAAAGVDGLIIVDLPPEEAEELTEYTDKTGLDFIRLITPVTDDKRLRIVAGNASGFLYYVSITGVTGTARADIGSVKAHVAQIKAQTDLPIAIGFGIKTPEDAKNFGEFGDAVVVGSSLVQCIEDDPSSAQNSLHDKVRQLKAAL